MSLNLWQHGPSIVEAFMSRGVSAAVRPNLWTGCELATLAQPWGGEQARDFARNNHGTLVNEPKWGYGTHRGGAFRSVNFDAAAARYIRTDSVMPVIPGSLSVFCWVRMGAVDALRWIVNRRDGEGAAPREYQIFYSSTEGTFRASLFDTANAGLGMNLWDTTPTAGVWYHVGLTCQSGGKLRGFVNGVQTAETDFTGTISTSQSHCVVGISGWNLTNANLRLNGSVADVREYHRALSVPEIKQLAVHPLAAYETRSRRHFFAPTAVTNPFAIDNNGVITIADAEQLTVGDTWEVEVEVAGSDSNTSRDTFLVQLLSALELQGTATLSITASGSLGFTQRIEGAATLTIDADATISIDTLLAATAELQIGATGSLTFLVGLAGTPTLDVDASGSLTALVSLAGDAELVIDAGGVLEGLAYVGAAPCRTYYVDAETRVLIVSHENRIMEVTCP